LNNFTYQYDDFKDEYEDEGMAYESEEDSPILTQTREGFPSPNRRGRFSYPNHSKKGGCPSLSENRIKIEIPSFSENLDIESFLD